MPTHVKVTREERGTDDMDRIAFCSPNGIGIILFVDPIMYVHEANAHTPHSVSLYNI